MSGGRKSNSVEAFDYFENIWTYLPDMIEKRFSHASVSMGNKMFVIAGFQQSTCEQFDSCSRMFSYIKTFSYFTNDMSQFQAVCYSNQVIIFGEVMHECQTK